MRGGKYTTLYTACACRHNGSGRKPKPLPLGMFRWMVVVWRYPQSEVIAQAGMDAAMHLRILAFGAPADARTQVSCCAQADVLLFAGAELFLFLTVWCLIVILPTNLSVSPRSSGSAERRDSAANPPLDAASNGASPVPACNLTCKC